MCFIFTCGEHTFTSQLQGYESVLCQCQNCGNYAGKVIKRHPWFTFCFIPVLPLAFHAYEDIVCSICNFAQPLQNRPDVQAQKGGGVPQGGKNDVELQNQQPVVSGGAGPPPGWGNGPPQAPKPQQNMQYA